jgi:predicted ester cyclase
MSEDAVTGAEGATQKSRGPGDLGEASRRLIEESFNQGNFALADELVAPEAVDHDPATPAQMRALRGPELLKRTAGMYRAAFPDVRISVDDVIVSGDKVVLRWHSEGTHRGELAGLAPTGARGSVTGISIDQWKDGKIVETWTEWDNLGLARQLGAAPPEGSVGEKIGTAVQRLMARRMRKRNPG